MTRQTRQLKENSNRPTDRVTYASNMGQRLTADEISGLVARVKAGDGRAWELLVRHLSPAVYRGIAAFTLSSHAREEVFSNTWLRLVEKIDTIEKPGSLVSWLMTTAKNEARQFTRVNSRLVPTESLDDAPALIDSRNLDESLLDSEVRVAVWRAFQQLPQRCQRLLRLLTVDPPLAYAEISEVLGLPHGSIGPNRMRCLDLLREMPTLAQFGDQISPRGGS